MPTKHINDSDQVAQARGTFTALKDSCLLYTSDGGKRYKMILDYTVGIIYMVQTLIGFSISLIVIKPFKLKSSSTTVSYTHLYSLSPSVLS